MFNIVQVSNIDVLQFYVILMELYYITNALVKYDQFFNRRGLSLAFGSRKISQSIKTTNTKFIFLSFIKNILKP